MSTICPFTKCSIAILLALAMPFSGYALEINGFKDDLFSYPAILKSEDGGDFLEVDYQEKRDINGRDDYPEKHVRSKYVSLSVRRFEANETLQFSDGRSLEIYRTGTPASSSFSVIFIHGRGGDRRLGANDHIFGGNFNRLKNLAIENSGSYIAPSIATFDSEGVAATADLIAEIHKVAPQNRIVLSCASMGSFICWGITKDKSASGMLAGMMIMGGATDPDFMKSPACKMKLPMFFSHGSLDKVYSAETQIGLYETLHQKGYPTRFVLFATGSHGTPIRMTDWKDSLQWILK